MQVYTSKIYCDRCGKEIKIGSIRPRFYNSLKSENGLFKFYDKSTGYDLCRECGKELDQFIKGAKLAN